MKPRPTLLPSDVDRILRAALSASGAAANDVGAASLEKPPLVTRVGDVMRVADALRHALKIADLAIEEANRRGAGELAAALRRQVKQLRAGEI